MLDSFCVLASRYILPWSLSFVSYHLTIIHGSLQTAIISFMLTYSPISVIIVVDELRTVLLLVSSKYHISSGPLMQHWVGKSHIPHKTQLLSNETHLCCLSAWKGWPLETPVWSLSLHFCQCEGSPLFVFTGAFARLILDRTPILVFFLLLFLRLFWSYSCHPNLIHLFYLHFVQLQMPAWGKKQWRELFVETRVWS